MPRGRINWLTRISRRPMPVALALCVAASTLLATGSARGEVSGCGDFANQAKAQSFYLSNGGPSTDPYGLDADGNGIACDASPAPYRGILSLGYAGQSFTGALVAGSAGCIDGRNVSVFKLRKGKPPKKIGSDVLDEDGNYAVPSTDSTGRFVAKIAKAGVCASEASAVFTVVNRRLEITPADGLLFTDNDQVRSVDAEFVDDATGARTPATDAWFRSTNTDNFTVDRDGHVTSVAKNGSAQIIASAQGITSAPILAVVVGLSPDAIALTDDQIESGPTPVDTDPEPPYDDRFTAILRLDHEPSDGKLYVSIEDKGLVGRVESRIELGPGRYDVMFTQVPLTDAVPELTIDESFDMGTGPVHLSDAAEDFNVTRSGTTLTFEEKIPPSSSKGATADEEASGPCKVTAGLGSPVKFTPFKATININPKVEFIERNGQFSRMVVTADPVVKIEHGVTVQAAFEATVKCEFELYEYRKPVPGFLGALIGFQVPIGFVFTVGGKVTLAGVTVKKVTTLKAHASLGVVCPDGGACGLTETLDASKPVSEVEVSRQNPLDGARLEPELSAKVNISPQFGAHEPKELRLTLLEAEYGPKLAGQFGTVEDQLNDDTFWSLYKMNLEGSITPGPQLTKLAEKLRVGEIAAPSVDLPEVLLAQSPTGTMKIDPSYRRADLALHLEDTKFLGLYNVEKVILVKRSFSGVVEQIEEKIAANGQQDFKFTYVSPTWANFDFYALVITKIIPYDDFPLEVAKGFYFSCKGTDGKSYHPMC